MGFITDEKLLNEEHRVVDEFDFSFVTKKIDNLLQIVPDKSLVCLVGAYGSGKSTSIHQVEKLHEEFVWFEFDAWKYPERKDLWENFVLELAHKFDEKTFQEIEKEIEGRQNDDKRALLNTVGGLIPAAGGSLKDGIGYFLKTSPATRTYQVQKILSKLLSEKLKNKKLIVIIEDIDRSGEAGVFFLETLKAYLQSSALSVEIKCLIPISTKSYDDNADSYLKCTDIIEYFRPSVPVLLPYMKKVLSNQYFDDLAYEQVAHFFQELFHVFNDQMSPRMLKHILRLSNTKFESMAKEGLKPDARVVMCIETSKLITLESEKLYRTMLGQRSVRTSPFTKLLASITYSTTWDDRRVQENGSRSFVLEAVREPNLESGVCVPWYTPSQSSNRPDYHLHDFYFDY